MEVRCASPTMVGRTSELAELRDASQSIRTGRALAVLVGGEAGVGKTRLVEEFIAEIAAERFLVVTGQCVELGEDGLPYAPIVGAIRSLISQLGAETVIERAGPGRDSLAGLVPELGLARLGDGLDAEQLFDHHIGRSRLFEVVVALLEKTAADQPLMLVIEDLHWADRSTRDLFGYLTRSLEGSGVLILATYRSDEIHRGHPLRPFLAELDRMRNVRRMEVPRLTRGQVGEQLGAILSAEPDPGLVERVFERSEGIPFFVEELVEAERGTARGPLPDSLRDLLLVRFEQVAPETRDVLRVLAVGGNRVDHEVVTAVLDADPVGLDTALREAISLNIVRVSGDGYAFRHALVREAIHDDLLPGEHTRRHRQFAEVLEERPELVGSGSAYVEIAHHYYSAHDTNQAFRAYLRATDEAFGRYAYGEAQRMGERALELWDRVDDPASAAGCDRVKLLSTTARAAYDAGEAERALALIQAALAETSPEDHERYVNLLWYKIRYWRALGRPGGMELLQEALDLTAVDPPTELRGALLDQRSSLLMLDARFTEAIESATEAMEIGERLEMDWLRSTSHNVRGTSRINLGRVEEGLADLERAREFARDEPRQLIRYYINTSDVLHLLGRYSDAVSVAEAGMQYAHSYGLTRTTGATLAGNAAEPLLALGDWDRAEETIDWALSTGPPYTHLLHLNRLRTWLTLWRGDVSRAADQLAALESLRSGRYADPQHVLAIAVVAAEVELARGNVDAAMAAIADTLAAIDDGFPGYDVRTLATAARILATRARQGADIESDHRRLAALFDRIASWESTPAWRAVFDAELGGAARVGDDPEAWRQARSVLRQPTAPQWLRGYAAVRHGAALAASGERAAAVATVHDAEQIADELGAGLLHAEVRSVCERFGLSEDAAGESATRRVRPAETSADPVLTAREAQVLRLVADGLSNRQIGEKLFISTKTASVHVSNILAKLEVTSRTEAAYVARRDGLLPD